METKMRKKQWGKVFFVFFLFFVCALAHPEYDSDFVNDILDNYEEDPDGWDGTSATYGEDIHDFAIDERLNSDDDDESSSASTGGSGGSGGGSSSSSSASESSAGGATESNSENSSSSSANNESVEDAEEEEEEEDEDFWSGEVEVNFGPAGLDGHAFSNGDEVFNCASKSTNFIASSTRFAISVSESPKLRGPNAISFSTVSSKSWYSGY